MDDERLRHLIYFMSQQLLAGTGHNFSRRKVIASANARTHTKRISPHIKVRLARQLAIVSLEIAYLKPISELKEQHSEVKWANSERAEYKLAHKLSKMLTDHFTP